MLKKLRKRVTVLFLIIAMVVGMLPAFPADTVKAANLIDEAEMTRRVKDTSRSIAHEACMDNPRTRCP
mgnify:CR=1 FL=1